jgi:cytidine deaminase
LQLHRRFITERKKELQIYKYSFFSSDVEIGFTGPCGSCRQILAEFNLDLDIYLVNSKNESKMYKLRELLPIAFTPHDLEKPRTSHDITD